MARGARHLDHSQLTQRVVETLASLDASQGVSGARGSDDVDIAHEPLNGASYRCLALHQQGDAEFGVLGRRGLHEVALEPRPAVQRGGL